MPPPSRDYERGRDEPYKRLPDEAGGDDFPSDAARETAEALVAERAACRVSRDYQRADQIRDELRRAPAAAAPPRAVLVANVDEVRSSSELVPDLVGPLIIARYAACRSFSH